MLMSMVSLLEKAPALTGAGDSFKCLEVSGRYEAHLLDCSDNLGVYNGL